MASKKSIKNLEIGDIGLSLNKESVASKLIAKVTDSDWSHVFMYIGNGNIIESTIGGVQITPLEKYLKENYNLVFLRLKGYSATERVLFAQSVLKYVGKRYGWFQILWYLFIRIIKKSESPKWQLDIQKRAMVCSEAIAQAMKDLGVEVKPNFNPAGVEPADFYESDKFKRVEL